MNDQIKRFSTTEGDGFMSVKPTSMEEADLIMTQEAVNVGPGRQRQTLLLTRDFMKAIDEHAITPSKLSGGSPADALSLTIIAMASTIVSAFGVNTVPGDPDGVAASFGNVFTETLTENLRAFEKMRGEVEGAADGEVA